MLPTQVHSAIPRPGDGARATSRRPLVDDALGFPDRALDCADLHVRADADQRLDVVLQTGASRGFAFHHDGEVIEGTLLGYLQDVMGREAGLLEHELLDLGREY